MKKQSKTAKICCAILFSCLFNSIFGQITDPDPGNSYSTTSINSSTIYNSHLVVEPSREQPKMISISGCIPSFSLSQRWPKGTWKLGYYDLVGGSTWCNGTFNNGCSSVNYWSAHPLIRQTEDYGRSYTHLARRVSNSLYSDRMNWALDYLTDDAQQDDGGFIWWAHRINYTTTHLGETSSINCSSPYPQARGMKTLTDGYWYLREIASSSAGKYYKPIEHGSNWFLKPSVYWSTTTNYKGFGAWALASAYKVTGEKKYLKKALNLCQTIMGSQDQNPSSHFYGCWRTGSDDAIIDDLGVNTGILVDHDTKIWYHLIILRGLIETMSTTPTNLPIYADMQNSIRLGINHIIEHRLDLTTNQLAIYPRQGGVYYAYNGAPFTFPANTTEFDTRDMETFGQLAHYSQILPGYTPSDQANLKKLLDILILGAFNDPGSDRFIKHLAMYNDYAKTIDDYPSSLGTQLTKVQVDFDLLHKFAATIDYVSTDGTNLGSTPVYSGSYNIENWLVGDFDGNGVDEVLQKFSGLSKIYKSDDTQPLSLGNGFVIYPGSMNLDKWIKGDFDGNGDDELLYKFTGSNSIYYSEKAQALGTTGSIYSAQSLSNWITGDFDGDGDEELLQMYSGDNNLYISEDGITLATTPLINLGAQVEKWIVGDFKSVTNIGKDELLYKLVGSNNLYKATINGTSISTSLVYSGFYALETWVVGDFDGDLDDELLQKFSGLNKVYRSEDGTALGANSIYNGAAIEKWIAGDYNGDGIDELHFKFTTSPNIYMANPTTSLPLSNIVYTGSQVLQNWITGNFTPIPTTSKDFIPDPDLTALEPKSGLMLANYPNPFEQSTTLSYSLPEAGNVTLEILDLSGRKVKTLVKDWQNAGNYQLNWDGTGSNSSRVSPGIYLCRITQGDLSEVKRLVLLN